MHTNRVIFCDAVFRIRAFFHVSSWPGILLHPVDSTVTIAMQLVVKQNIVVLLYHISHDWQKEQAQVLAYVVLHCRYMSTVSLPECMPVSRFLLGCKRLFTWREGLCPHG